MLGIITHGVLFVLVVLLAVLVLLLVLLLLLLSAGPDSSAPLRGVVESHHARIRDYSWLLYRRVESRVF